MKASSDIGLHSHYHFATRYSRGFTDNRRQKKGTWYLFERKVPGTLGFGGGKSELRRATQGLTALRRKVRNSGTERISGASSLKSGTGDFRGAAGVKTAKLCVKQDQIGKRESLQRKL